VPESHRKSRGFQVASHRRIVPPAHRRMILARKATERREQD
jgi:hypothetical protein